jgi:hypothetical protein
VGPVLSDSEKDEPDAVDAAVALQVFAPTVQLTACAAQATGAGALQVLDTALHAPLVHAYVAAPVFGALVFCSDAVKPDVVCTTAPLQLLPPTDQLKTPALHPAGALHEALVGVPHTPLLHEKLAAPVVGALVSETSAAAPDDVAAAVPSHVLVPTFQLTAPAEQPTGALQVAPVAAPHRPLLHENVAAPVVGAPASVSVALAPSAVVAAAASHVLPPTVQLSAAALQATGAVQETLVGAPHTPLLHEKLAAPVVGAVVSESAAMAPEAVDTAVALQTLVPTVQLNAPEHGAAATGTAHVVEVAAPHAPLEQEKVAAPVVGAVVSLSTALKPDAVAADVALQVLAPTVQLKGLAAQPTGALHVVAVAGPQAPLLQAKVAAPVVGATASVSVALAPEAVAAAAPSHVLPPTVQLRAAALHAMGAVHETLVAAPHVPLLQVKLAAPVVGAKVSERAAVAPEAVAGAVALQVLAPEVQLKSPDAHADGDVQVALVAAPHTPLAQAALAVPVVGAIVSDSAALAPDAVAAAEALHVLLPTVQLIVCAVQAIVGATIALP